MCRMTKNAYLVSLLFGLGGNDFTSWANGFGNPPTLFIFTRLELLLT